MVRKKYQPEFKARVALEAVGNNATIATLARKYNLHPNLNTKWKSELIKQSGTIFAKKGQKGPFDEVGIAELERKIGQLTVENDF